MKDRELSTFLQQSIWWYRTPGPGDGLAWLFQQSELLALWLTWDEWNVAWSRRYLVDGTELKIWPHEHPLITKPLSVGGNSISLGEADVTLERCLHAPKAKTVASWCELHLGLRGKRSELPWNDWMESVDDLFIESRPVDPYRELSHQREAFRAYGLLTRTDELLVMATALHGSSPEIVDGINGTTANAAKILKQVLIWRDLWNEETIRWLCNDGHPTDKCHPTGEGIYADLIRLTQSGLLRGFGNLGSDTKPPSYPTYVAFGLRELGRLQATELFGSYPEYVAFDA